MTDAGAQIEPFAIDAIGVFAGPSPFATAPVVAAKLALSEAAIARAPELVAEVHSRFPELRIAQAHEDQVDHGALLADFVLRWAGAALSHTGPAISPAGLRSIAERELHLWIGFFRGDLSFLALSLAVDALRAAERGEPVSAPFRQRLSGLLAGCARHHPGAQYEFIKYAADARDLPFTSAWGLDRFARVGWGSKSTLLFSASSNRDGGFGAGIIADKLRSKTVIARLGLPTPRSALARDEETLDQALARIGYPCVIKPLDQHAGTGVTVGVRTPEDARKAFDAARKLSRRPILVEALAPGDDHRLAIAGGEFRGAIKKLRPEVVGDGTRSVRELTTEFNRGRVHARQTGATGLAFVETGRAYEDHLASQDLTPDSIPQAGRTVTLHGAANQVTGGNYEVVNDIVHPDVKLAALSIARTLGADVVGFDYITTDISRSWQDVPSAFIELNLTPGLSNYTKSGWSMLETGNFAIGDDAGRIPVDVVVVPDALVDQTLDHVASLSIDNRTGIAGFDRAQIGSGLQLDVAGQQPWAGVMTILANRAIDRAVFIAASSKCIRHGLPVDRAERVWVCDAQLPAEWRKVCETASRGPAWHGDFDAFRREFAIATSPA